ncbi:MAG: M23 family peptidase, partial [Pseudomonadota bacterium]
MNIILVSGKLAKARTLTLTLPHLVLGGAATLLALLFLAFGLQYSLLRYAGINSPLLTTLVLNAQQEQNEKTENYLRDSLNA